MPPERPLPPLGRRLAPVTASRPDGAYRVLEVLDPEGPEPLPGQFYMVAEAPDWGGSSGRPYLPRAISFATAVAGGDGLSLEFLLDEVGPGTRALSALTEGSEVWLTGPLGSPFSDPGEVTEGALGAVIVGGGIGIAPLAALRRSLVRKGIASRTLLGFREPAAAGGVDRLFGCEEVRVAYERGDDSPARVTDLLARVLSGDSVGDTAVYSCGPPAMLEAVRQMCAEAGVGVELALESPMACGYGACFGCAVPKPDGGFLRLCIDGPVVRGDAITTACAGEAP